MNILLDQLLKENLITQEKYTELVNEYEGASNPKTEQSNARLAAGARIEVHLERVLLPGVVPPALAAVPRHHLGAQQDRPLVRIRDRAPQPGHPLRRLGDLDPGVVQAGGGQDRRVPAAPDPPI